MATRAKGSICDRPVLKREVTGSAVPPSGAAALGSDQKDSQSDEWNVVGREQKGQAPVMALAGSLGGLKIGRVRTRIAYPISATSAANTALTTVFPVEPALSGEFNSFAAVFSECKVHGGEVHYAVAASGTVSQVFEVLSYDPMSSTALSSVAAGCEFSQMDLRAFGAAATSVGPAPVTARGLYTFKFRCLKGSGRVSATATQFQGEWSATTDAADTYGFLKPFVGPLGGAITSTLTGIVILDVSFRSRA